MAGRAGYHHGDLAAEAVAIALADLATGSAEPLSLRAIATRAGVAHRALYNHFGDREGFLAAVAAAGYAKLAAALQGTTEPLSFLRSYARFALDNPALYRVMMERGYGQFEGHPDLRAAADKVIALSLAALAPDGEDDETRRRAVMRFWMMAHGGLGLHLSGVLRRRSDEEFVDELLQIAGLADGNTPPPQSLWTSPPPGDKP